MVTLLLKMVIFGHLGGGVSGGFMTCNSVISKKDPFARPLLKKTSTRLILIVSIVGVVVIVVVVQKVRSKKWLVQQNVDPKKILEPKQF